MKNKKFEVSKIFLFIMSLLSVFVVCFSVYQMIKLETYEPLCYIVPAVFTELTAATASYYIKAKDENKVKIMLSAVESITADSETLTDEKVRVIEAMIGNLHS